jgi:hypothetical protein
LGFARWHTDKKELIERRDIADWLRKRRARRNSPGTSHLAGQTVFKFLDIPDDLGRHSRRLELFPKSGCRIRTEKVRSHSEPDLKKVHIDGADNGR